ncbi:MAG: helix-turn-helix transcriptional regulator [Victivallaceae bacterium]|nr:helix-turn-helix transcriptional regulator [Victivallaceae bacterium]
MSLPSDREMTGRRVRAVRRKIGLTQAQLAEKLLCSQQHIVTIEKGGACSARLLRDLSGVLGVSVEFLSTGRDKIGGGDDTPGASPTDEPPSPDWKAAACILIANAPEAWLQEKVNELVAAKMFDGAQLLVEELKKRGKPTERPPNSK